MSKQERDTEYRSIFILGISFLPLGLIFTLAINPVFISFIGVGATFMAIGLANRDKWTKSKRET